MHWFFIAILGPLFWSVANHTDKFLLEKFFKGGGTAVLMLFSTIFAVFVLPILYIVHPAVFNLSFFHLCALVITGILNAISIYLYLRSLEKDEATVVVPLFQLNPVFAYILGYFFLGEMLTTQQLIAGIIVIMGALIISFEVNEENRFGLKKHVALYMTLSSFLLALNHVIFKVIALEISFIPATFWSYFGYFLVGVAIFSISPKHRGDFLALFKNNKGPVLGANALTEVLTIAGNMFISYATLLAPIGLVFLVYPYQPVFVFAIGVLLTKFAPHIATEKISGRHLFHKIAAILVVFIGSYFLY